MAAITPNNGIHTISGDVQGVVDATGNNIPVTLQAGASANVVSALAGTAVPSWHKFTVAHANHATLALGVNALTIPAGALVDSVELVVDTAFDGTTPFIAVAFTQADAVAATPAAMKQDATAAATAMGGNVLKGVASALPYFAKAGAGAVWVSLTDGASGDPASTVGNATVFISLSTPA